MKRIQEGGVDGQNIQHALCRPQTRDTLWSKNLQSKGQLGRLSIKWRIILKLILKRQDLLTLILLMWRIG